MHVLDVKLRSGQVRRARLRMAGMSLMVLFGTILGAYGLWRGGEWMLDQLVYRNAAFAIRTIEVATNGSIPKRQLCSWADVRLGQNLLALDIARVKRNLEMVPAIETVAIERVLPKTLRIRVTEREPVLQVAVLQTNAQGNLENRIFNLDSGGVVMLPLNPRERIQPIDQPTSDLPRLVGLKQVELQPARPVGSLAARAALLLASEFSHSPMAGLVDLQQIDIRAGDVLVVTTGQGSEITFGLENLNQQLARWRVVHDEGRLQQKGPLASLDLSVANNAPAKWMDPKVVPPPVKPSKTTRPRKRNV